MRKAKPWPSLMGYEPPLTVANEPPNGKVTTGLDEPFQVEAPTDDMMKGIMQERGAGEEKMGDDEWGKVGYFNNMAPQGVNAGPYRADVLPGTGTLMFLQTGRKMLDIDFPQRKSYNRKHALHKGMQAYVRRAAARAKNGTGDVLVQTGPATDSAGATQGAKTPVSIIPAEPSEHIVGVEPSDGTGPAADNGPIWVTGIPGDPVVMNKCLQLKKCEPYVEEHCCHCSDRVCSKRNTEDNANWENSYTVDAVVEVPKSVTCADACRSGTEPNLVMWNKGTTYEKLFRLNGVECSSCMEDPVAGNGGKCEGSSNEDFVMRKDEAISEKYEPPQPDELGDPMLTAKAGAGNPALPQ